MYFSVLLPVISIFAVGFLAQKVFSFDVKQMSTLSIYCLYPFLAFLTFYENPLTNDAYYILIYCLVLCFVLLAMGLAFGWFRKLGRTKTTAVLASSAFMNSGNYGVPLLLFTYGDAAATYAIFIMVIQSILMNTVGLFLTAYGSNEAKGSTKDVAVLALKKVAKMPILYAVILGWTVQITGWTLSNVVLQPISLIADAAIPIVMIALGMQLANIQFRQLDWTIFSSGVTFRMIISPLIVIILLSTVDFGMDPLLVSVFMIVAGLPAAANMTMFAVQFQIEPNAVSAVTLVTTLLSIVTLPILFSIVPVTP
ncbi:AEC family transporter [Bacillus fonticola]|uniref:AEC family transporter n=1 Tax=Bacillus fonticola TaxID=2728853 RepID=UPI0014759D8A|nr:AEC family transporter [Bacillus fonticola]